MAEMKKIAATLLAFLMIVNVLIVAIPEDGIDDLFITAYAASSGTCGDNLTWVLDDDGTLTISGTGAMTDWTYSSTAPWYGNSSSIKSVVIDDGVTSIDEYAFYNCSSLKSITIPDSVTSIGSYAFYGCSSLKSVTIPDSVTDIGKHAFYYCNSLTSVTIPDSVTSIGDAAFLGCRSMTGVYISDIAAWCGIYFDHYSNPLLNHSNPLYYAKNLYLNGNLVTDLVIPDSVTGIGDAAFIDCSSLESVTIPNSVTRIYKYAFNGCTSLTDVYYGGNEDNWNKIYIGSKNGCLTNATIHFNSTGVSEDNAYAEREPLEKSGVFEYNSMFVPTAEEEKDKNKTYDHNHSYVYTYDENWFEKSSYEYQHDLTKMSMRLALASYGYGKTNSAKNVEKLMRDLEFSNIESNYETPNVDTIGYAIGSKKIKFANGETYSLVIVGVRGGNYGNEWGGNFRVGYYGVHEGFQLAADQVLDGIESYVSENKEVLGDNIKIWIAGYSRGGATTNLVAKELDLGRIEGLTPENIYAFCFECPQNTVSENAHHEVFNNIVSIVNPIDFVPYVAMSDWGVTRYGKTYYLPFREGLGDSEYYPLKVSMVKFYKQILELNGVSTDFDSNAPWTESNGQAEVLNRFWNTFAKQTTSTVPYLPLGSNVANKLVIGGIEYVTLGDIISEAEANGSTKERIYYAGFHQENFIKVTADLLGGDGIDFGSATSLGSEILKIVPGLVTSHPILTGQVVTLFAIGRGPYGHYPELCLAWLDSLEGEVGYVSPTYRRVLINCPVDVNVTNSNGVTVAEMIDDVPQEIENGIYAYVDDDGQKVFILPNNEEYTINITATDNGTVTYTVNEYNLDTNSNDNVVSYYEIPIETGDVLVGTAENLELTEAEYPLSYENGELLEADVNQSGNEVVKHTITIESGENGAVSGAGEYTSGQYIRLIAVPNDGYCFSGWYQGDELISTDEMYRILVDNDYAFSAYFEEIPFTVTADSPTMLPDETQTLIVNEAFADNVTWTSSNEAVATVDSSGTVTAHALGTVVITATAGDASVSCTIEVIPPITLKAMGGSVRIVEPYGLRFGIQFKKDDAYNQYKDIIVSYGTLIIPKKNLGDTPLTFDVEKAMDVPAVNIYSEDSTQLTYTGVLVGIPKSAFYSDIVGCGYLKYLDVDGNEKVIYTDEIVRSYYQVANSAYIRYGNITDRDATEQAVYEKLAALLAEMTA